MEASFFFEEWLSILPVELLGVIDLFHLFVVSSLHSSQELILCVEFLLEHKLRHEIDHSFFDLVLSLSEKS